jgi:nitrogen regulatory protein P-II 1
MTTVVAIIRPNRFDAVKEALQDLGVSGMTVSEVRGHGRQKGHTETYRGREYDISLLPKLKVEIATKDDRVEAIVDAIITNAATGSIGDGKIFLYKTEEVIRIRNQERGEIAV